MLLGTGRFKILYTLLENDPEKSYNQHIVTTDKSKVLQNVWLDLKDNFGYQEQTPLVSVDESSARPWVRKHRKDLLSSYKTCAIVGEETALTT